MLNVSIRDSRSSLLQKATKIKVMTIVLRICQVLVSFCCLIGFSYSLVHPGWWTNFKVPSICTYSVAVMSAVLDVQQVVLYLQGRTGSTIFKNNVPTQDISAFVKSQYGIFLLFQSFALLGWLTAGAVLISIPHGKNFRESFNDPPVAAWDLAIASAFVEVIFSFFACFLVHRERQLLDIHLKRNQHRSDGFYNMHLSDYPRGPSAGSNHTRNISSPIGPPRSGVYVVPSPRSVSSNGAPSRKIRSVSSAGAPSPHPRSVSSTGAPSRKIRSVSSAGAPSPHPRSAPSDRSLNSSRSDRARKYDPGKKPVTSPPSHMRSPPRAAVGLFPNHANLGVPSPTSDAVVYDGNWI